MYNFQRHHQPQADVRRSPASDHRWRVWVYAEGGFWLGQDSRSGRFTGNGRARSFKTEASARKAARKAGFNI